MIISRLLNAIREQNWFSVFLEFLVIMIGVFMGLQFHDWTVDKEEVTEKQQTLLNLERTINADIDQFRQMKQTVVNKIASLDQLENIVRSGDQSRSFKYLSTDGLEDDVDFYQGLENSVQYGWQFPLPRSVYIIKSGHDGAPSMVMNASLNQAVQNYFAKSSAMNAEINARVPGYADRVYQMIGQGERTIFADGQKKEITTLVMPTLNSELAIGEFISKANNENFLSLLRAEKNYAGFCMAMIEREIELAKALMQQIEKARD